MTTETPVRLKIRERSCGTCTKCCEGYLTGVAHGIPFFSGKPCHFVDMNSGCSIYEDRPDDPCNSFKCGWLTEPNFPEWLKPNLSNVIFTSNELDGHYYIYAKEAGATMDAMVLSWAISYMANNKINFAWEYGRSDAGAIGSDEFLSAFYGKNQGV
jgi:hypothetical protein